MREREAALRRHLRRGLALCEPGGSSPFPFAPPTTSHAPPSLSRSSSSEPAQDANILCRSHTGNIVRRIRFIGSWSNIRSKGCNPPPPHKPHAVGGRANPNLKSARTSHSRVPCPVALVGPQTPPQSIRTTGRNPWDVSHARTAVKGPQQTTFSLWDSREVTHCPAKNSCFFCQSNLSIFQRIHGALGDGAPTPEKSLFPGAFSCAAGTQYVLRFCPFFLFKGRDCFVWVCMLHS